MTLHGARLRRRWAQELLAVAGIAVGVALIYASAVACSSLRGPVRELSRALVAPGSVQLVGRGPDGFSEAWRARAARVPGVARAIPVLEVPAAIAGPRGGVRALTLVGADPRFAQLRGGLLRGLLQGFTPAQAARQRLVVLPAAVAAAAGVRFGDDATLLVRGRALRAPAAVVGGRAAGPLGAARVAVVPLRYLQRLAGLPGRVTRVVVELRAGARPALGRLAAAADVDVRPADHDERLFAAAVAPTTTSTAVAGIFSGLVGFLFAVCALLVGAGERRALAADLRVEGFSRARIARMLGADALGAGLAGSLCGLALGELLSRRGFVADVGFLGGAFPIGDARVVTALDVALAAGAGLLAAAVGVLGPLWAPRGRRRARPRHGLVAGAACLALCAVVLAALPRAAVAGLVLANAAAVLVLPAAVTAAVAVAGRVAPAGPGPPIALASLRAGEHRARSVAIAATGALAVLGAVALHGSRANLQDGLDRVASEMTGAPAVWVSARGPGDVFGTVPIAGSGDGALARRLGAVAGVRRVAGVRAAFADVGDHRVWVIAQAGALPGPSDGPETLRGDGARVRRGGWAALSAPLAGELGVRPGGRFTLPSARPVGLRLAAVTTNIGWAPGAVLLSPATFASAYGSADVSALAVLPARGVALGELARRVGAAVGRRPGLRVETSAARIARQRAASRGGLARLGQIAVLMQLAAVLAMAAATTGLVWQRRVGVARLKLDGLGRGALWRALALECALLFAVGCLVGAAIGLLGQVLLTAFLHEGLGFPVLARPRLADAAVIAARVAAAAAVAVAVPGWLVAGVRPGLRVGE